MKIISILALGANGALGHQGKLPWYIPEDLKRFKKHTLDHTVIMGRRTYESLPKNYLPNRHNIVVTRGQVKWPSEAAPSLPHALAKGVSVERESGRPGKVFIIGGAQLYTEAMPLVDEVLLTRVLNFRETTDTMLDLDLSGMYRVSREETSDGPYELAFERWVRD